jgi:hypothetical protein
VLYQGLKRVRGELVRVHGGERPPQIVETVIVLAFRLHPGSGLKTVELLEQVPPRVIPGEDARLERRQGAEVFEHQRVQRDDLIALAFAVLSPVECPPVGQVHVGTFQR